MGNLSKMGMTHYINLIFLALYLYLTYIYDMRIEWTRKAFKHLLNVDNVKIREKIYGAVDQLRDWPVKKDVKVLKGREGYRLRVGKYRVIFNVFDTLKIISIEEVKKRDERTY